MKARLLSSESAKLLLLCVVASTRYATTAYVAGMACVLQQSDDNDNAIGIRSELWCNSYEHLCNNVIAAV